MDILVIGAGVAGLTAARDLNRQGLAVTVLEKSRGLGGRAATRRVNGNRVDHGAQYFTVRDERLQEEVKGWLETGHARVWAHGFHTLTAEGLISPGDGHPRYIFPDGMNSIGKLLGKDLDIRTQTRAARISPADSGWRVITETGDTFNTPRVLVNTPAEQAFHLFDIDLGDTDSILQSVQMTPCFALMAGYPLELTPSWRGVKVEMNSPLAWVAHDSSKRESPKDCVLVLHASPDFTKAHYEIPEKAETLMIAALRSLGSNFGKPLWTSMQRWRYAQTSRPHEKHVLKFNDSLLFCGDWCGGAKVEAAYLSGLAAAREVSNAS